MFAHCPSALIPAVRYFTAPWWAAVLVLPSFLSCFPSSLCPHVFLPYTYHLPSLPRMHWWKGKPVRPHNCWRCVCVYVFPSVQSCQLTQCICCDLPSCQPSQGGADSLSLTFVLFVHMGCEAAAWKSLTYFCVVSQVYICFVNCRNFLHLPVFVGLLIDFRHVYCTISESLPQLTPARLYSSK